jgi:hypothetical protein
MSSALANGCGIDAFGEDFRNFHDTKSTAFIGSVNSAGSSDL